MNTLAGDVRMNYSVQCQAHFHAWHLIPDGTLKKKSMLRSSTAASAQPCIRLFCSWKKPLVGRYGTKDPFRALSREKKCCHQRRLYSAGPPGLSQEAKENSRFRFPRGCPSGQQIVVSSSTIGSGLSRSRVPILNTKLLNCAALRISLSWSMTASIAPLFLGERRACY